MNSTQKFAQFCCRLVAMGCSSLVTLCCSRLVALCCGILVALWAIGFSATLHCQVVESGSIPWTQTDNSGLERVEIRVPPRFSALGLNPAVNYLYIPIGWSAQIFFSGSELNKARFITWGPDSVLFVANMNRNNVLALVDADNDGIADTAIVAASGFSYGHDVRFYRDTMFVIQESGVVKLWRSNQNSYVYDQRVTLVNKGAQANQTGGNHRTRTLVLDTNEFKLYINVGSRGNADREQDRAVIEQYKWDGTGKRVYSMGVRNAVGMTLHPRTGKVWANNNGSDQQGNNVPPEWFDIVRENGFYGYPFAYHYKKWFDFAVPDYKDLLPITSADTTLFNTMVPPSALLASHSAPMAVVFASPSNPTTYKNGAFMALRGSWNRTTVSGNKVVFVEYDNDMDTIANVVKDFCVGFIPDTTRSDSRWARPVGIAVAGDGSVYITSDDLKQFVLKVTPPIISSVGSVTNDDILTCSPNPTSTDFTCHWKGAFQTQQLVTFTAAGSVVHSETVPSGTNSVSIQSLPSGVYTLRLIADGKIYIRRVVVSK